MFKFMGIGEASAAAVMAVLRTSPAFLPFTVGIQGKILFFILKLLFSWLASLGLIVLNVGAAKIETVMSEITFDGSIESAEKAIKAIRDSGRELTPEEIKAIDEPVIDALRKFASFGRDKRKEKT